MSWIKQNKEFNIADQITYLNHLPKGTYYVRLDPRKGFYLEQIKDFILPNKVYGNHSIINRWLTSYRSNDKNTGIILSGIKGSGKTLLAKQLAIESELPVIIVDKPFSSSDFISFITNPAFGDVCIMFDEFEKVYDTDKEDVDTTALLSILDGTFNTHNLFIFTCNHVHNCVYLTNRPSRIKYRKHFDSLEDSVIDNVIQDLLINKDYSESLKMELDKIGIITFDLLITIINEMNLFNESANDVLKHLNIVKEQIYVKFYELWKNTLIPTDTNRYIQLGDCISVYRLFGKSDDPEYVNVDMNPNGLEEYVEVDTSKAVKINENEWKIVNDQGVFIMKRYSPYNLLF